MDLYKQTIELEHLGTTDVMEWIQSHPEEAKGLSYTTFVDKYDFHYLMVSLHQANSTLEDVLFIEAMLGELDAFKYKGMRRVRCMKTAWYFEIDGNVYFCSC